MPAIKKLLLACLLLPALSGAWAQTNVEFQRTEDVIYGRKFGTALTLDVFQPRPANGVGIIFMVSGGLFSSHESIKASSFRPLLNRGYTVFPVVHGSQPKFVVTEIVADIHRAVRFIRHNAARYGVDPNRFGITGASSGGFLSLTMGTQGCPGDSNAKNPADRESSVVQCVACFFPPTDFLNYSRPGEDAVGVGLLERFKPGFRPALGHAGGAAKAGPGNLAHLLCPLEHAAHFDHPRRRRYAGTDLPIPDLRQALRGGGLNCQTGRSRWQDSRLAGHGQGHGDLRRLVRRASAGHQTEAVILPANQLDRAASLGVNRAGNWRINASQAMFGLSATRKKGTMSYFKVLVFTVVQFGARNSAPGASSPGAKSNLNVLSGPAKAQLGSIAQVELPAGYVFLDGKSTRALMKAAGEPTSGQELGFLRPTNAHWSVLFEFSDIGYVKDDEKDKLNADKLLDSFKSGTAEANKERVRAGNSPLEIVGWEVPPRYDATTHNLEWAVRATSEGRAILNYNTRLLGRKGVMEVVLIVEPEHCR